MFSHPFLRRIGYLTRYDSTEIYFFKLVNFEETGNVWMRSDVEDSRNESNDKFFFIFIISVQIEKS